QRLHQAFSRSSCPPHHSPPPYCNRTPEGANWPQLVGIAALCGVGFTMSLFIGSLAFEGPEYFTPVRLGVIVGSMLSGGMGYLLLRFVQGHSGSTS
ncbi:Na+/H+ antiporter NhaA, partial [Paraburkholderia sediminicola]|nr:Na+/H+ antiporter NhaA [Paraburkholderia sediminicola]